MAVSPEAAEIIRRKKTQYCRFADTNQFHLFEKIAFPNATFKFAGTDGNVLNESGIVYSWENLETFSAHFSKAFETVQVVSVFRLGCLSPRVVSRIPPSRAEEWRTAPHDLSPGYLYHLYMERIANLILDPLSWTRRA